MKTDQFAQILEVAKTGSFSQAARNLFISQPTLSYNVKQMEKEIGFSIFQRTSEGVIPTPEGIELLSHMKRIQKEVATVEKFYQHTGQNKQTILRVAVLNLNWISVAFEKIVESYANKPINFSFLTFTSLEQVLSLLERMEIDFAVVGFLKPYEKLTKTKLQNLHMEYHKLASYDIKLVVGRQNPLYDRKEPISLKEIYPYPLIYFGNNDEEPHFSLEYTLGLTGLTKGRIQVNSSRVFYNIIAHSQAVGLIVKPAVNLGKLYNVDIALHAVKDIDLTAEEGWVKMNRLTLTPVAKKMLETIKENC